MKRVTISEHKISESAHFDIFFETDFDYLLTYEILSSGNFQRDVPLECIRKQNHRLLYLDYEGEISEERGTISIYWRGFLSDDKTPNSKKILIEVRENSLIFKELDST